MMSIKKTLVVFGLAVSLAGCGAATPTTQPAAAPQATQQPLQTAQPIQTQQTTTDTKVEFAFTQASQHPEQKLIQLINSSKETLDIAIYSLTYPDIVKAIKEANSRGVKVRIVTDKIQSEGKTQKEALKILIGAGIPVKINHHSGLMHLKVTIVDNQIATTGSFNYSKAASTTNDEVFVVLRDKDIAKSFESEFVKMWMNDNDYVTYVSK